MLFLVAIMHHVSEAREAPTALVEAAATLLAGAGGGLLTTQLVKALFYLDLYALLETGKTVTGVNYVALKAGPVVENYRDQLIRPLEETKIALQEDDNPEYKPVILLHPVKQHFLSKEQSAIARNVAQWARKHTSTALSVFSHENPGWIHAWHDGDGQGSQIDLNIAMQQLLGDDPWMRAPLTDDEKRLFAEPDAENFLEW